MYTVKKAKEMEKLVFEPGPHRYLYNGFPIPGVTSVVDGTLDSFAGLPKEVRDAALQRGDLVHRMTSLMDAKPWRETEIMEWAEETNLVGYLEAWLKFKKDFSLEIVSNEQKVLHTKHRFAGTADRVGYLKGSSHLSVIEIKTGIHAKSYRLQTAAYKLALNEGRKENLIDERWAVVLDSHGHYSMHQHKGVLDEAAFLAALTIENWKRSE